MIVDNGTVSKLAVEAPGKLEVSAAEAILEAL
jgi:peroxiredoxin